MKEAPDHLIYESAYRGNILPLTSVCNVRCIFCSHSQNPQDIHIYRIRPRSLQQVEDTLQFIHPENKVVIGESVTKIVEGEPFTHPEIKNILTIIRKKFPYTGIQITTNGTLIDSGTAEFLAGLGGIEINLSLNSAMPNSRRKLMNDFKPVTAVKAAELLACAGVPFHGSLVAMPHLTGWDDIRYTILYLADTGAVTIRVFLPGFTRLAPEELKFGPDLWRQLTSFVESVNREVDVPVTVEPPYIRDLIPRVTGVIKGSPADLSGVCKNDVIRYVNESPCSSRVDAFWKALRGGPLRLDIERNGTNISLNIDKQPDSKTGLVMDYDIDPALIDQIIRSAGKYEKVKILCSVPGAPVLREALETTDFSEKFELIPVKNRYFGGSIEAAGLLVVSDFLVILSNRKGYDVSEALFLPSIAFDRDGRDLTGMSFLEIGEKTGQKVEII